MNGQGFVHRRGNEGAADKPVSANQKLQKCTFCEGICLKFAKRVQKCMLFILFLALFGFSVGKDALLHPFAQAMGVRLKFLHFCILLHKLRGLGIPVS